MERKDEIKMSWEKKVSMREIAQFYEDKLRELDGKYQFLTEQLEKSIPKIRSEINELNQRNQVVLNGLSQVDQAKNHIEETIKQIFKYTWDKNFNSFRSEVKEIQNEIESSGKEETDRLIDAFKESGRETYLRAMAEINVLVPIFYGLLFRTNLNLFNEIKEYFKNIKKNPDILLPAISDFIDIDNSDVAMNEIAIPIIRTMVDDYVHMFSNIEGREKLLP